MKNLFITKGFFPKDYFQKTAKYILAVQLPSGAIPWFTDGLIDPWDHIEAAMGLSIAGFFNEARAALNWMAEVQEPDGGFWPAYAQEGPLDTSRKESHHAPYLATGVWHYYLITNDKNFLIQIWPAVEKAIDFACNLQSPFGEMAWACLPNGAVCNDALVTGCSSIFKSLECALLIAQELGINKLNWSLARTKLAQALKKRPYRFDRTWESKARYAMDWFYPVLCGVVGKREGARRLACRWEEFVIPELGCRCVTDQPWVTVAETCELVMALLSAGEYTKATKIFSWLHKNRDQQGAYWTGYQFELDIFWPKEQPTWTAGAILLAADSLAQHTPAHHLFSRAYTPDTEDIFAMSANAVK